MLVRSSVHMLGRSLCTKVCCLYPYVLWFLWTSCMGTHEDVHATGVF